MTYVYDNDGELTDTTDADGRRTTYSYDADGDQTGETWVGASPSEMITYTYDADNELTGAADAYATLTFTYDSGGNQITSATSGPGNRPAERDPDLGLRRPAQPDERDRQHLRKRRAHDLPVRCRPAADDDHDLLRRHGRPAGRHELRRRTTRSRRSRGRSAAAARRSTQPISTTLPTGRRRSRITSRAASALATYVYSYDKANRVTTRTTPRARIPTRMTTPTS